MFVHCLILNDERKLGLRKTYGTGKMIVVSVNKLLAGSFRKGALGRRVIVTVILCFCLFVVGFVCFFHGQSARPY